MPQGRWIDWWQPERSYDGGTHEVDAPLDTLPLYQRAGSVLALAHPDLMTAVEAEEQTVADPSSVGEAWELRTSKGPTDRLVLVDGTSLEQMPTESGLKVTVNQPKDRQVVIRVQVEERYQRQPELSVDGSLVVLERTEDEWSCPEQCVLISDHEVVVVGTGKILELNL